MSGWGEKVSEVSRELLRCAKLYVSNLMQGMTKVLILHNATSVLYNHVFNTGDDHCVVLLVKAHPHEYLCLLNSCKQKHF